MTDDQDPVSALLKLLRQHAPELLPICRYLVIGPYLADGIFDDITRSPTVRELITLKRTVERHGPSFTGLLTSLLKASGKTPAVRVEIQIDRLLEVDPSLWTHPAHVLERPLPDPAELLEACRLRLAEAGEEEAGRLKRVEEKLQRSVRIEETARERREKRSGKGAEKDEE